MNIEIWINRGCEGEVCTGHKCLILRKTMTKKILKIGQSLVEKRRI